MSSRSVQAPVDGRSISMGPQTWEQVRDVFHHCLDLHMNKAVDVYQAIVESCQT